MKNYHVLLTVSIFLFTFFAAQAQNVGIGTATPNAAAQLEVSAADKGILIPRVNLTATNSSAPIGSWVQGLLVYNLVNAGIAPNNVVANQFYYSNGSQWLPVGTGWGLTGNTGTTDGQNFIGTTDAVPLTFRVKNAQAGRIDSALRNTFFGYLAGNANTTGSFNTACGFDALRSNTTGVNNTAIGAAALRFNTTGFINTASGANALRSNTTGSFNTANGVSAFFSNTTGSGNTASGAFAFFSNTTGSNNTATGRGALRFNTTGSNNTGLGAEAGSGATDVDFSDCTFIGANSSPTVARVNVTMLGAGIGDAQCTGDNQVLLGNTAITQIRAQVGSITTYSDARFKVNIKDNVKGLDFIMRLNPVSYQQDPARLQQIWNPTGYMQASNPDYTEIKKKRFVGFLAQEVEKAALAAGFDFPGIDVPQTDTEVYTLRYVDFIMPMVKAMQEQQGMIQAQQQQIAELKMQNATFYKELQQIKALLEK